MRTILLFFLVLISTSMHAKKLIQATCEEGKGCTFEISELDASEYDVITGKPEGYHENLPENAIFVNTKLNGSWEQYVETGMTRSQLDQFYGGDGFTMIYPFNPYFQPVDGQWQIKIGTVTGDICYGQESNIFKSMLQGMNQSGNITFPKPFHARFLMNNANVKWVKIRPDYYKANLGNALINLKLDVQIISNKKIDGFFTATIIVPTKEPCINKIPITYTCVKENEWEDPWDEFMEPYLKDDLLPINSKKDDLLPIEPGKAQKPKIPRLDEPNIPRIED